MFEILCISKSLYVQLANSRGISGTTGNTSVLRLLYVWSSKYQSMKSYEILYETVLQIILEQRIRNQKHFLDGSVMETTILMTQPYASFSLYSWFQRG